MPKNEPAGTPDPQKELNAVPGNRTLMAVLSYIGPLIIVSFVLAKNDSFVKFHIKQGTVLIAIEIVVWILGMVFMSSVYMLLNLVNLATLVLSIIGIVYAVQGKEKELPVVGGFSKYFTF